MISEKKACCSESPISLRFHPLWWITKSCLFTRSGLKYPVHPVVPWQDVAEFWNRSEKLRPHDFPSRSRLGHDQQGPTHHSSPSNMLRSADPDFVLVPIWHLQCVDSRQIRALPYGPRFTCTQYVPCAWVQMQCRFSLHATVDDKFVKIYSSRPWYLAAIHIFLTTCEEMDSKKDDWKINVIFVVITCDRESRSWASRIKLPVWRKNPNNSVTGSVQSYLTTPLSTLHLQWREPRISWRPLLHWVKRYCLKCSFSFSTDFAKIFL